MVAFWKRKKNIRVTRLRGRYSNGKTISINWILFIFFFRHFFSTSILKRKTYQHQQCSNAWLIFQCVFFSSSLHLDIVSRLFEDHGELLLLFNKFRELKTKEQQASSEELAEHANKVMETLDEGIRSLDELDTFFDYLHQVGSSHTRIPEFKSEYFWVSFASIVNWNQNHCKLEIAKKKNNRKFSVGRKLTLQSALRHSAI